jgi:hypothetical protein
MLRWIQRKFWRIVMTLGQWFGGVFDRALGRWVSRDPAAAEATVAGLLDKIMGLPVFWDAIGNWLDANPDRVEPFVTRFLDNVATQAGAPPVP